MPYSVKFRPHFRLFCRRFVTKEDVYPFTSGAEGQSGLCDKGRTANIELADKVQLVGGGFRQLRQWSNTALLEVRARPDEREQPSRGFLQLPSGSC